MFCVRNAVCTYDARFSKAMKLPQQRERVYIDGLGDIGKGKYTKKVEKINIDDIIDLSDEEILQKIRQNKILRTINVGKQGKHIKGHNNYIAGRSYLMVSTEKAQELVNRYSGTGNLVRTKNGHWRKQEIIISDTDVGYVVDDLTGTEKLTKAFKIHYSQNGVHIVPKKE